MTDTETLAKKLLKQFGKSPLPPLADKIWCQSPALRVIDCVLSLNRNYDRFVTPRVERFAQNRPDVQQLHQLRQIIDQYDTPLSFSKAELCYNDAKRANTLFGVINHLLEALLDYEGQTETIKLEQWASMARPGDYLSVGVPGFGLAGFQYLRMLFEAQTTKPDVHIIGFVSDALGRKVNDVQALYLLERAAKTANLSIRLLDVAIWESRARG